MYAWIGIHLLLNIPKSYSHAEFCSISFNDSTAVTGSVDYIIDLSLLNTSYIDSNDSFLQINTCSDVTDFDTYLYLYTNPKRNPLASCNNYCSNSPTVHCTHQNGAESNKTIWDLDLDELDLIQTIYTLEINGYKDQRGSFEIMFTFPCDSDISITQLNSCVSEFSCPFNISIGPDNIKKQTSKYAYFNFNRSVVDQILGRQDWDMEFFMLYNFRLNQEISCVLFRDQDKSIATAVAVEYAEFMSNDTLAFTNTTVFCQEPICQNGFLFIEVDQEIDTLTWGWLAVILMCSLIACFPCCIGYLLSASFPCCITYLLCASKDDQDDTSIPKKRDGYCQIMIYLVMTVCATIAAISLGDGFTVSTFDKGAIIFIMGWSIGLLACFKVLPVRGDISRMDTETYKDQSERRSKIIKGVTSLAVGLADLLYFAALGTIIMEGESNAEFYVIFGYLAPVIKNSLSGGSGYLSVNSATKCADCHDDKRRKIAFRMIQFFIYAVAAMEVFMAQDALRRTTIGGSLFEFLWVMIWIWLSVFGIMVIGVIVSCLMPIHFRYNACDDTTGEVCV